MTDFKFGKLPATEDRRDLKLASFVTAPLPYQWPKPNFGNGTLFPDWQILAPEILNAGGTWRGLDITALNADLAAI